MFRKIHSNRDPGTTFFGELKKEFRPYFDQLARYLKRFALSYPKFLFGMMVINILLSIVLCLTIMRPKVINAPAVNAANPLNDGFDQVRAAAEAIKKAIRQDSLKHLKSSKR